LQDNSIKNISHIKIKFSFQSVKTFFGRLHIIGDRGEEDAIHVDDNFPKYLTKKDDL